MERTPIHDEPDIDISFLPERKKLLEKLVNDLRHTKPPIVFGVHGDWGAGKTSFLQAAMHSLTGTCPCHPDLQHQEGDKKKKAESPKQNAPIAIWFEAWRYQNEPAPVVALLHELRAQLSSWVQTKEFAKDSGAALWRNFMLALDSITLKVEAETGLFGTKGKVGASVSPFQMAKSLDDLRASRLSNPLPSNQLREALDGVLEGLLSSTKISKEQRRIIIFIDDLDRCSASVMFSLLESIKIYLNLKHCVFVLGINRHELERNIASILPEPPTEEQKQVRAHEYIEKLCGNVIRLPFPSKAAVTGLVAKWLNSIDGVDRKSGDDKRNDNSDNRDKLAQLASEFGLLPSNPRRMKMWCNTASLLYQQRAEMLPNGIEWSPVAEGELPALALAASLHTFYPQIYNALQSAPSFIDTLKKWCVAEHRFEPELAVFSGIQRTFVKPQMITSLSNYESEAFADWQDAKSQDQAFHLAKFESARKARLASLAPILSRAYGWSGDLSTGGDKAAEGSEAKPIPLLTDPSSLQYFHPQRLVAAENITEELIRPYLHLD